MGIDQPKQMAAVALDPFEYGPASSRAARAKCGAAVLSGTAPRLTPLARLARSFHVLSDGAEFGD
jgi:hypothetical protein